MSPRAFAVSLQSAGWQYLRVGKSKVGAWVNNASASILNNKSELNFHASTPIPLSNLNGDFHECCRYRGSAQYMTVLGLSQFQQLAMQF
jgi:hypothetical protein